MKTPPPPDHHLVLSPAAPAAGRDRRFIVFVGLVLVALALGFKSELVAPGQAWGLGGGLLLLAVPALAAYLGRQGAPPAVEHFVPVVLGAVAISGLSVVVSEWWRYGLIVAVFGVGFCFAAHLDYRRLRSDQKPGHAVVQEAVMALSLAASYLVVLTLNLPLPLRLAWIFAISLLAGYRSFRLMGASLSPRRAFLFALFVAQLVTFFAWAMSSNYYFSFSEGVFAVMLFLLWYVNRGVIRHTVEETLNRNVVLEYGLFGLLIAYLFFTSYQPH